MRSPSNFASSSKAGLYFPTTQNFQGNETAGPAGADLAREAQPWPRCSEWDGSHEWPKAEGKLWAGQTETTQRLPIVPHQWGWGPAGAPAAGLYTRMVFNSLDIIKCATFLYSSPSLRLQPLWGGEGRGFARLP